MLASQMSDDSIGAVRSVFATSATVWPGHAEAAALAGTSEAGQPTNTPTAAATATEEAAVGETTVSSALVDAATASPSPTSPATAEPTIEPTIEQFVAPVTPVPTEVVAAPTTAPTEAARVSGSGLSSVEAWLAESPWPPELWPTVERIVMCESSGNPAAVGPGGYVGLMQVDPSLHGAVPADPVAQLAQGYDVYLRQGWGAWGCY